MRLDVKIAAVASLLCLPPFPAAVARGQTSAADRESQLREIPDAARIREANRVLSAEPHHVGSPYGEKNARWILERFREYGLEASIETFWVLFPTPKERRLELLEPVSFRAALFEPPVPGDPTSGQTSRQLPTYNAYSIDGDVTAPLVYVNYGVPDDYEKLASIGIDVKGKIVIARYGASWRGIKPKVAAEHGAVGCILYSDPREDGYFQGDVYPKGALRPEQGVQRGSVKDSPLYSGDPLTPGVGSTKRPEKFDLADAKTLTKIPVLPISYGDAKPLLSALAGPVAPPEWRGALPMTYHVGPGPAKVRLKVSFDWKIVPAHDVIARIEGSTWPDEWVIHGNHHDAWVNGATDPVSGMAPLLEQARSFGELLRKGWRPKRTIVLCAWDAEEQGLIGSTEWAETHAEELSRKAVVYINSDSNGRGFLSAGGSHTLEPFVNAVASAVSDPEKGISVGERLRAKRIQEAKSPEERREIRERRAFRIEALGSGSDFTPFLQHLGIASLNLGYGGEDDGGVYHSIYDDFAWYTRFADKDFAYGRALAQTIGTAVLRLADAEVLPFDPAALSDTVVRYVGEVQDLAKQKREAAEELARQIDEGSPRAVADPREPFVEPKKEAAVPYFDFSPLENASAALARAAREYEAALAATPPETRTDRARVARVNAALREIAPALTREEGLPGRPWYRHYVYAPGFYTGYAVKTLPAVREAIEQKRYGEVNARIAATAQVLAKAAEKVNEAAEALKN
ncbi:MAG: M28 family metallopeptidase [Thermoanaerobaculia bacterium]